MVIHNTIVQTCDGDQTMNSNFLRLYAKYLRYSVLLACIDKQLSNDNDAQEYYEKMRFMHRRVVKDAHRLDNDTRHT